MDRYRELAERLRGIQDYGHRDVLLTQGTVESVHGVTCDVRIGGIVVPDVRLKASETADSGRMLVVPAVGSAVIAGSLTGDLSQLVVLHVDRVERIEINGGRLGGLVNIGELTSRLNALVEAFNTHTHTSSQGQTGPPVQRAETFKRNDYEDILIRH